MAKFDAFGSSFDHEGARASGAKAEIHADDGLPHFGSLAPQDGFKETGLLLKGTKHPTFFKTLINETNRGNRFFQSGGRVFAVNKDDIEKFTKKNKDAEDITERLNRETKFMEPFSLQAHYMPRPNLNLFQAPVGMPPSTLRSFR